MATRTARLRWLGIVLTMGWTGCSTVTVGNNGTGGHGGTGGTTTTTGQGGTTSSSSTSTNMSSGAGGNDCEPGGGWCTCGDVNAYHCVCTCSTDLPGTWPTDLTATDAADCAAHNGEACIGFAADPDAGAGTRTCVYQKLPWCGI